ncbi:MAG: ectoine/hydroxyectoine ABC transporter substrate-binding protein EhuB [Nocardioidaceae bacterium]
MTLDAGWSRRDFLQRSLILGGVLATPTLIGACSRTEPGTGKETGDGGTLQKIKDQGYVTVGFAGERPYAFREGGELIGEAPAIHGEIFKQIGDVELRPQLFEFGALIPALTGDRVDVVTAGMFITPERCEQAAFSNPEYVAPTAILTAAGNPEGITDFESALGSGGKLAVMNGAVELDYAKGNGFEDNQLQVVADQQSGLDAVKAGRAVGFALTSISLRSMAETDKAVEVAEPFVPMVDGKEQLGAGAAVFRSNDTDLIDAFNEELAALLDSDKWLELVEPFGFTEAEKPDEGLTAETLCKG